MGIGHCGCPLGEVCVKYGQRIREPLNVAEGINAVRQLHDTNSYHTVSSDRDYKCAVYFNA